MKCFFFVSKAYFPCRRHNLPVCEMRDSCEREGGGLGGNNVSDDEEEINLDGF